jgi:hypothetical protein
VLNRRGRRPTMRDFNERPGCFDAFERDVTEAEFQAYERWCDEREAEEDRFEARQSRWLTDMGDAA